MTWKFGLCLQFANELLFPPCWHIIDADIVFVLQKYAVISVLFQSVYWFVTNILKEWIEVDDI